MHRPIFNILLLGLVSLIVDASSEMIMPIFPLFLASLGAGGLIIGLIGGLGDCLASALNVLSGWWSDRIGRRKPIILFGYGLSAFMKILYPIAQSWTHLLIARPLERAGKGIREAPRDALLAESTGDKRGKGFGIHRAMDTTGAIIGTVFVFFLVLAGWDFRSIFTIAVFIAFLAFIPFLAVKDVTTKPVKIRFGLSLKRLPNKLRLFIAITSIFALANFTYMFLILRAGLAFGPGFEIAGPVGLYLVFNIIYMLFAIPMGVLADKIGKRVVIGSGYVLFGLTYLGFALFSSFSALLILFIVYGLGHALIVSNQRAFVAELAPAQLEGTALGSFHTATALAMLIGNIIAGLLWEIEPATTFMFGTVLAFFAALGLLLTK